MESRSPFYENKYKKDEIMEQFQNNMNEIMNKFYEKNFRATDPKQKFEERQKRSEEEFKRNEKRILEKKLRYAETNQFLEGINKKEQEMIERYKNVLGIEEGESSSLYSKEEKLRLIALKRKFPKKILKPLQQRQAQMYTFPHDIWHMISLYLETLSALKLEKACMSLYLLFNKTCDKCDNKQLRLSHDCKSYWRHQYQLQGCPYKDNDEYMNVNCRVLKALVSRHVLIQIYEERILSLRQRMCLKGKHLLRFIKREPENFVCDLCSAKVPRNQYCGKPCMRHKEYDFCCLYQTQPNGSTMPHKCFCVLCMASQQGSEAMLLIRRDIGFYFGLKKYTVFINFGQSQSKSKIHNLPKVRIAFLHEY